MISALDAVILGIIEGLTEFLPISSTGHLILASRLLKIEPSDFLKSFEIAIQLGAILSVLVLYWRRLFLERGVFVRVAVAFVPTGAAGFLLYPLVKTRLLENSGIALISLFLGGMFLIAFEHWRKEKQEANGNLADISYKQSFAIGVFQAVSIIPGVSRAAATIVGGMAMGLRRETIVEFSFLLAVPTMVAATGYDFIKNAGAFTSGEFNILTVGFAVSFVMALAAIKFLLAFIKNHTFTSFGVYRVVIALIFWLVIF